MNNAGLRIKDRSVRPLDYLENSASTSRVLNLRALARARQGADYAERPLFRNRALNTSIIVKHRLRPNETDAFSSPRSIVTKILIPIETEDLRLGARYLFVGQINFEAALRDAFGITIGENGRDLRVLQVLDQTPSLDPFLLREQLKRHSLEPALCYFGLSVADARRMLAFAQREIEPLVSLSGAGVESNNQASKLAGKILSDASDADLDLLRKTLMLDVHQFQDGVFCWKAFLYYKWQLADLLPRVAPVLKEIETIRPRGPLTDELRIYLGEARIDLRTTLTTCCKRVRDTLAIYDRAYMGMVRDRDPRAFRDFLLDAPRLFGVLGERLSAVEHLVSFWRFRFPQGKPVLVSPDDLADLFRDFEGSLGAEAAAV